MLNIDDVITFKGWMPSDDDGDDYPRKKSKGKKVRTGTGKIEPIALQIDCLLLLHF